MQSKQYIRHVDYAPGARTKDVRLANPAVYADERDAVVETCERFKLTQSTLIRVALAACGITDAADDITCGCGSSRAPSRGRCPKCGLVKR